jgi:hypothetical protein
MDAATLIGSLGVAFMLSAFLLNVLRLMSADLRVCGAEFRRRRARLLFVLADRLHAVRRAGRRMGAGGGVRHCA